MLLTIPSTEDIKSLFPNVPLTKCQDKLSNAFLENMQEKIIRNCSAVETTLGGGQDRHAGLAEFPNDYLLQTGTHFNHPNNPGLHPMYPPFPTQAQCDQIKTTFETQLLLFF